MAIVGDAHVHIYPHYSLSRALIAAETNLLANYHELRKSEKTLAPTPSALFLSLSERTDCNFFAALSQGRLSLPTGYSSIPSGEQGCITLRTPSGLPLHIFAGRQIVTSERLELLSIGSDARIPDGLSFLEGLRRLTTMGVLPALNWAPGKWLFRRQAIVESIIDSATAGSLLLCDTTLRPTIWAEPLLMRKGREKGLGIIRGSDPLPISNEEEVLGSYGVAIDIDLQAGKELATYRAFLKQPSPTIYSIGCRNSPLTALRRIRTHMKEGR
jgi:hypothetical protein